MPSYPDWPERWEFFDGILKYCPEDSDDIGGECDFDGVPLLNEVWIVVHGGEDPVPRKPRWPKSRKKRKKNRTKKRKPKRKR